jgi:hypothetical protein
MSIQRKAFLLGFATMREVFLFCVLLLQSQSSAALSLLKRCFIAIEAPLYH